MDVFAAGLAEEVVVHVGVGGDFECSMGTLTLLVYVICVYFVFYLGLVDVVCGDGVVERVVVLKGYW